ncbi:MazG family protein [Tsukamurella soli]|uniref:Nucleoside triphosphate pyrophosphohydrolase n=1 Tax=Tsukamurella soli TaxID=644556 RepID=A0ABP8JVD3_9ACTN
MTVIRVNPALPTLLPVEALPHLGGPVYYTEELPVRLAWHLPGAVPLLTMPDQRDVVVITSNVEQPDVAAMLRAGHELVSAPAPAGLAVLDTVTLIDRLRTEGPWESRQTHASLVRFLVEETYELVDAVSAVDDPAADSNGTVAAAASRAQAARAELRSELGDLLLQVVFHARIAQDDATAPFGIDDVARTLTEKIRRRTPHLGGGVTVDIDTQARNWELQKAAERGDDGASCLDGIAAAQPALALAQKVFERLRGAGFPADLIPGEVRTVTVDPTDEHAYPEVSYRTVVLRFMDRVRAAEVLLRSGKVESWPAAWAGVAGDGVPAGEPVDVSDGAEDRVAVPDDAEDDSRSKKKSSKKK